MKEQMTIHKALCELKTLDARIGGATADLELVVPNKHTNSKIGGIAIGEFAKQAIADFQSAKTLINRRNAIKQAVTRSNATTKVTIGGEEYTVAEAIDMKTNGIGYLQSLRDKLAKQLATAKKRCDMENDRLEDRADEYIRTLYGGSDLKNMGDEVKKVREDFIASQTFELVDPINADKELKALDDKIAEFLSDVDSALSVSNALTSVDVEYMTL